MKIFAWILIVMIWVGIVCTLSATYGCSSSDATAEFPSLGEHEVIIVHDSAPQPSPSPVPDEHCPPFGEKAKGKGPCR